MRNRMIPQFKMIIKSVRIKVNLMNLKIKMKYFKIKSNSWRMKNKKQMKVSFIYYMN